MLLSGVRFGFEKCSCYLGNLDEFARNLREPPASVRYLNAHASASSVFYRILTIAVLLFGIGAVSRAEPMISEFMASNATVLADEDGNFPDWVEIYNPDSAAVNLNGWYLTDNANKKTKWMFPSVAIAPHGYLVVFASGKNRRDPTRPLPTS